ncbi:hypothetical protein [Bowmanella yangjiangensis]|uniref:Uncharacterized protein n=1 Tax=Bowmanella yangjiangensis TaxID=2811230 RepID=A0ABS3CVG6_9ALTE|nr:hypothetical protein [Bowmanella yangjiangensis]MBN7820514.1 hypothetical protein [Bowmanella yangjiangensis]
MNTYQVLHENQERPVVAESLRAAAQSVLPTGFDAVQVGPGAFAAVVVERELEGWPSRERGYFAAVVQGGRA